MKIAMIADLHSNLENWKKISALLGGHKAKELIIAGDITDISMLGRIAEDFSGLIHVVFGNMDQQTDLMEIAANKYSHLRVYGWHGKFAIAKQKFIVDHYEAEAMARITGQGKVIVVCGHTHEKKEERTKNYLLINPGTAGGIFQPAQLAIYDLNNEQLNFINI